VAPGLSPALAARAAQFAAAARVDTPPGQAAAGLAPDEAAARAAVDWWAQRLAWQIRQVSIAVWFLTTRAGHPDTYFRAAVILRATPDAPETERFLGMRADPGLYGTTVRCARCAAEWTCQVEDPYFGPGPGPASDAGPDLGGLCTVCVLADTRRDEATAPITGTIVEPPGEKAADGVERGPAVGAGPGDGPDQRGDPPGGAGQRDGSADSAGRPVRPGRPARPGARARRGPADDSGADNGRPGRVAGSPARKAGRVAPDSKRNGAGPGPGPA
jgi:hypothetical protein